MTSDLDDLILPSPAPESAVSLVAGRHVHVWTICPCGAQRDLAAPRRGRSAHRLGGDQERRIERVYGPRKVGEHGDAVDHIGRDFVWQSKATRSAPPAWLALVDQPQASDFAPVIVVASVAAMEPLRAHRAPLVIQSFVANGKRTIDRIWVRAVHWHLLHGWDGIPEGWLVMSGEAFLELHGRDDEGGDR